MTVEHWIDLKCHPLTRPEKVRGIQVLVRRSASAELQMTFRLDGDIPDPGPFAGRAAHRYTALAAYLLRSLHRGGRATGLPRVQFRPVGGMGHLRLPRLSRWRSA